MVVHGVKGVFRKTAGAESVGRCILFSSVHLVTGLHVLSYPFVRTSLASTEDEMKILLKSDG